MSYGHPPLFVMEPAVIEESQLRERASAMFEQGRKFLLGDGFLALTAVFVKNNKTAVLDPSGINILNPDIAPNNKEGFYRACGLLAREFKVREIYTVAEAWLHKIEPTAKGIEDGIQNEDPRLAQSRNWVEKNVASGRITRETDEAIQVAYLSDWHKGFLTSIFHREKDSIRFEDPFEGEISDGLLVETLWPWG